ncbi:MAG: M3 family metallopeptidase, partial [Chitinophagaceae bacterium]|nr:M3 family metallopeptidase [Chitinophagaceae bacterium]
MKKIFIPICILLTMTACNNSSRQEKNNDNASVNPLLHESTLPYTTPDFSKIKNEDYRPAILEGIQLKKEAISKIANNPAASTFENTLVALEKSGESLDRALAPFYALTGAYTNDTLQQLQEEIAPLLSDVHDFIYLNDSLFHRIQSLYDKQNELNLDKESLKLLDNYYTDFKIAGAALSTESKEQLKKMNARLATLTAQFNKTLLAANNSGAVVFKDKQALSGLTDAELAARKNKDGDGWKIPLQNTTQQPLLASMTNRNSRKELFMAAWNRGDGGENDTKAIITEIATLRAQKARILGFENYAQWSLQKTMAKTPENVFKMFDGLVPAATGKAQIESDTIQQMIKKSGEDFRLEPYDWNLYAEKVRKEKYDLDENEIKPYFLLKTVLEKGVFYATTQLYGITFKRRTDIPVYHPDVLVYELFEEDGSPLGLFYGDYFARPSKRGGAWMSNLVEQSRLFNKKPVIYNVCNYPKPAGNEPALLTYDEVSTLFHEFGHALHGFFANQEYPSLSGTNVARDFVEFPSQ